MKHKDASSTTDFVLGTPGKGLVAWPVYNEMEIRHALVDTTNGFLIRPEPDMGDAPSREGWGFPVVIERYEGETRLLVWADINQEDPTHIISLEGARESARREIS